MLLDRISIGRSFAAKGLSQREMGFDLDIDQLVQLGLLEGKAQYLQSARPVTTADQSQAKEAKGFHRPERGRSLAKQKADRRSKVNPGLSPVLASNKDFSQVVVSHRYPQLL